MKFIGQLLVMTVACIVFNLLLNFVTFEILSVRINYAMAWVWAFNFGAIWGKTYYK